MSVHKLHRKRRFQLTPHIFLFIFLLSFSAKAAITNTNFRDSIEVIKEKHRLVIQIDKNSTKAQLQELKNDLKEKYKLDLTFKKLKFNKEGMLSDINITVKTRDDHSRSFHYPIENENPILPIIVEWDTKNKEKPLFIEMVDNGELFSIYRELENHKYLAAGGEKYKFEGLQYHLFQYRSMWLQEDGDDSFFVVNGIKSGEGYNIFYAIRRLLKEGSTGDFLYFHKKKEEKRPQPYFITLNKDPEAPSFVSGYLGNETFSSPNRRRVALAKSWFIGGENIEFAAKSADSVSRNIESVEIDRFPIYPGCEKHEKPKDQRACLSKKARELVSKNIDKKILSFHLKNSVETKTYFYADFFIDKDGEIKDIITLAPTQYLSDELLRILKLFPKSQPAMKDGEPLRVSFNLPVVIAL